MALSMMLVWLCLGAAVAGLLARRAPPHGAALLRVPVQLLLWPLFVPLLLPREARQPSGPAGGEWDAAIRRAEAGIGDALDALSRQVEDPLSLERARVASLGHAMRSAAARLSDLDRVLASPGYDVCALRSEVEARRAADGAGPVVEVLQRRLEHVERLAQLRRQARLDLERALEEAAALASRLTLLRYEGSPHAGDAAGSARELTLTVEELCRVLNEARAA